MWNFKLLKTEFLPKAARNKPTLTPFSSVYIHANENVIIIPGVLIAGELSRDGLLDLTVAGIASIDDNILYCFSQAFAAVFPWDVYS